MASSIRRPVRVAGCSGGFTDRSRAIKSMAEDPDVDAVIGDWMAEMTMTMHGSGKAKNQAKLPGGATASLSLEERMKTAMYAETFIQCFEPAIEALSKNQCKLAVNAGASDTELLAQVCQKMVQDAGHGHLKIAWVEGDDVTQQVNRLIKQGEQFESLMHGKKLEEWGMEPICAQAYLGGLGIAEALRQGADIVICGRVADAAPVIGVAAWWHGWKADQLDELAGALIAGHLIECSAYVTGGYYGGFKEFMKDKKHVNMGFPIAEIDEKGECVIVKEKNTGGAVNVGTVASQLLYEIQGPWYYNCDVVADITGVVMEQAGEDAVRVTGVKGLPPPPTTKVGITAPAGFQAEWHIYFVGLDIEEKCRFTEDQIRYAIGDNISKFTTLKFHQNGSSPIDAHNQDVATVDFRIFAQSRDPEVMRPDVPNGFNRWVLEVFLQSAPGASLSNDLRQIAPKPYYEYWVSLLPQAELNHRVHCLFGENMIIKMDAPTQTRTYPKQQPSYETTEPRALDSWGETEKAPLGYIVLGRSGDKASDCNAGFFVRHADEWEWLRSFLTIDKLKELLGPEEYKGKPIDRFEIPGIKAVHFLLHDHLDRGYNGCSTYDTLGKNACEYIRAKTAEIPKKFLERGRV
ncbi:uncharacterized protein J7T54_006736 [Emericellopsis cladophorae]|uniref:DUF1446-domain-containing protein n=1 Tax=Emericellopsis cladophorae TaxID=2686198 RepID=A0A9P9Y7R9_9HYPO|nr:uncharacterized protein J7T54_006736 [Emericellopsis cladophorae]KAI6785094.1 hypothetical protein J7T54_006736 [Emericellopsis cladophorae]